MISKQLTKNDFFLKLASHLLKELTYNARSKLYLHFLKYVFHPNPVTLELSSITIHFELNTNIKQCNTYTFLQMMFPFTASSHPWTLYSSQDLDASLLVAVSLLIFFSRMFLLAVCISSRCFCRLQWPLQGLACYSLARHCCAKI